MYYLMGSNRNRPPPKHKPPRANPSIEEASGDSETGEGDGGEEDAELSFHDTITSFPTTLLVDDGYGKVYRRRLPVAKASNAMVNDPIEALRLMVQANKIQQMQMETEVRRLALQLEIIKSSCAAVAPTSPKPSRMGTGGRRQTNSSRERFGQMHASAPYEDSARVIYNPNQKLHPPKEPKQSSASSPRSSASGRGSPSSRVPSSREESCCRSSFSDDAGQLARVGSDEELCSISSLQEKDLLSKLSSLERAVRYTQDLNEQLKTNLQLPDNNLEYSASIGGAGSECGDILDEFELFDSINPLLTVRTDADAVSRLYKTISHSMHKERSKSAAPNFVYSSTVKQTKVFKARREYLQRNTLQQPEFHAKAMNQELMGLRRERLRSKGAVSTGNSVFAKELIRYSESPVLKESWNNNILEYDVTAELTEARASDRRQKLAQRHAERTDGDVYPSIPMESFIRAQRILAEGGKRTVEIPS